jgi:methanogenic corrinoid protein MtbC1
MSDSSAMPFDMGDLASLGIRSALLGGDPGLAYTLISEMMADGTPMDEILFDVLAPIQRDLGSRWLQSDYRIAQEHAASASVETVVAVLAGSFDVPFEATHVVVACAEGENHSLPARMVAAHLTYAGLRPTFLGATLPADDLGAYLQEEAPVALVLSCTAAHNLMGARDCVRAAHGARVPVITGGRAFGADSTRSDRIGADGWVSDPRTIPELLESWSPDITVSEGRALDDGAAKRLFAAIPGIVERILGEADHRVGITSLRNDLLLLGKTLVSAVLIDDRSLLDHFYEYQTALHERHDDVIDLDSLVALLRDALPADATAARTMLGG